MLDASLPGFAVALMLADHADLTREHLSELENGHKEMGVRALEKIVQALDLNLHQFFEGM